jgi:hypothetical protein
VGVLILIVWWIRPVRSRRERGNAVAEKYSRIDFKNKPSQSAAVAFCGFVLFGAGPIGLLYYFLLPTTFTPSTELRSFFYLSLVVVVAAGIYLGATILLTEGHAIANEKSKFSDLVIMLLMPIGCPLLLALCWLFFVSGPMNYALHLLAQKEIKTVNEPVLRGTTSGVRDFTCGGFWVIELRDHSFWWPRQICNVELATMKALERGGTITLRGKASRFGMDVESYRL